MKKTALTFVAALAAAPLYAQAPAAGDTLTTDRLVAEALGKNELLHISRLKGQEQASKTMEMKIKLFPTVTLNTMYMYRFKLGSFALPAGSFGVIPMATGNLLLPSSELSMELGKHNTWVAGAMLYQPLTQLPRIATGISIAKADERIAQLELTQAELKVKAGVEQLAYGLMAVRAQEREAEKRIEVAQRKLADAETARLAGKALEADIAGLNAELMAKEQDLLDYKTKENELLADLRKLTGLDLQGVPLGDGGLLPTSTPSLQHYKDLALGQNVDLRLSEEQVEKSRLGLKAARLAYLPDVGAMAGYTYQNSTDLIAKDNPYVGVSLSWNLQSVAGNRQTVKQVKLKHEQAVANVDYTRRATLAAVEKAYDNLQASARLVAVAEQAADYADKTLKTERDRMDAGLTTPLALLTKEADQAKAEADLYAAKQKQRIAQSELDALCAAE